MVSADYLTPEGRYESSRRKQYSGINMADLGRRPAWVNTRYMHAWKILVIVVANGYLLLLVCRLACRLAPVLLEAVRLVALVSTLSALG